MPTYEPLSVHSGRDAALTASTASSRPSSTGRPRSQRLSVDGYYYNQLIDSSRRQSDASDHPPSYDAATQPQLHFKVQPRENEGKEQLPKYSCSIMIRAVFAKKMELESAVHRAQDRKWSRVFVDLQGTALRIYKTKSVGIFSKAQLAANLTPDLPPYLKPGMLLRTYSLQYADVGVAADYIKRRYVIRIRAEMDQFLLSCIEIETFLQWLESLSAAIDLAPPLEERKIPRDTSMPQRRRRTSQPRQNELLEFDQNAVFEDLEGEEVEENMSDGEDTANHAVLQSRNSGQATSTSSPASHDAILPAPPLQPTSVSNSLASRIWAPPIGIAMSESLQRSLTVNPAAASSNRNPSITENNKWRPQHAWSPMCDLIYARRCMRVLRADSPRKTNLVIMKGKKWTIDWATGTLTRLLPPDYGEINPVGPLGTATSGAYESL